VEPPQKGPPHTAAVSVTSHGDLVGPYKDFQAYCEIMSEQLQDRFADSGVPILSAFLKPQDLASAILQRTEEAVPGEEADWDRMVDERVSDLEEMFREMPISLALAPNANPSSSSMADALCSQPKQLPVSLPPSAL